MHKFRNEKCFHPFPLDDLVSGATEHSANETKTNQTKPNQTTAKIFSDPGILWIYNIIICHPVIQSIFDKKYLFRKFIIIIEWFSKPPISQLEQSAVHWLDWFVSWLVSDAAGAKFTKCKYRMQWNRSAENSWNFVQRLHLRLTISISRRAVHLL